MQVAVVGNSSTDDHWQSFHQAKPTALNNGHVKAATSEAALALLNRTHSTT